jgi:hypothetical protein
MRLLINQITTIVFIILFEFIFRDFVNQSFFVYDIAFHTEFQMKIFSPIDFHIHYFLDYY